MAARMTTVCAPAWAVLARHNWTAVTMGSVSMSESPMVPMTYLTSAAPRRRSASTAAVRMPTSAPCQRKWSNAQPIAWAAGSPRRRSIPLISNLPCILAAIDQPSNLAKLFLGRATRRQDLHDELGGRSAKCTIEQVADELTLRLLFSQARLIDVGTFALVAADEPLFGHDLQHLQCGGIG